MAKETLKEKAERLFLVSTAYIEIREGQINNVKFIRSCLNFLLQQKTLNKAIINEFQRQLDRIIDNHDEKPQKKRIGF